MNSLIASCVLAEHTKLKRTLARGLSIAAPTFAVLLALFAVTDLDNHAAARAIPAWRAWLDILLRVWASFLLPIMATLQAVLIAQLEHANRRWKYLLALPVPRTSLYLAKSVHLSALLMLAHAALWLLSMIAVVAFDLAPVALGEAAAFVGVKLAMTFIAALVLAAVQLLVSIRLKSFVSAISIGLVATLVAALGATTMRDAAGYFPWSMPIHALGQPSAAWFAGTVITALLATVMGMQCLRRMQVH